MRCGATTTRRRSSRCGRKPADRSNETDISGFWLPGPRDRSNALNGRRRGGDIPAMRSATGALPRAMIRAAMPSTPAQKFVCPRCRTAFDEPGRYCAHCGADMTHASPLEAAQRAPSASESTGDRIVDRRLSDSNQAWLGKTVDGRYRVLEVI